MGKCNLKPLYRVEFDEGDEAGVGVVGDGIILCEYCKIPFSDYDENLNYIGTELSDEKEFYDIKKVYGLPRDLEDIRICLEDVLLWERVDETRPLSYRSSSSSSDIEEGYNSYGLSLDWSKLPIDTPLLINGSLRYFAGVDKLGYILYYNDEKKSYEASFKCTAFANYTVEIYEG